MVITSDTDGEQERNVPNMKRWIVALGVGLLAAICVGFFTGFAQDCREIRESVLRLHILANSDSEEDQALKLKVRDRILEESGMLFDQIDSVQDAKALAEQNAEQIAEIARDEIQKQGYDYTVKVEVCNMFFDTRNYDSFSLPAGHYDALRVTIGEAKGHNWWCVLYPPMCLPGAMPREELEGKMTAKEAEIIEQSENYQVEFAVIELWEKVKNLFCKK